MYGSSMAKLTWDLKHEWIRQNPKFDLHLININSKILKMEKWMQENYVRWKYHQTKYTELWCVASPQSIWLRLDRLHSARRKRFINFKIALIYIRLNYPPHFFLCLHEQQQKGVHRWRANKGKHVNQICSTSRFAHQIQKSVSSKMLFFVTEICFWNHLTNSYLVRTIKTEVNQWHVAIATHRHKIGALASNSSKFVLSRMVQYTRHLHECFTSIKFIDKIYVHASFVSWYENWFNFMRHRDRDFHFFVACVANRIKLSTKGTYETVGMV